jgi:hypothetical protein
MEPESEEVWPRPLPPPDTALNQRQKSSVSGVPALLSTIARCASHSVTSINSGCTTRPRVPAAGASHPG